MNEVELEAMVVRLLGDGSQYANMINTAVSSTKQAADQCQKYASDVDGFGHSLSRFAEAAVSSLELLAAERFLHKAFDMYKEAEVVQVRLKAAIQASGAAIPETLAAYSQFAETLREATGASKGTTLSLLQMAETRGISGDAAMRAVKVATELAAAIGGEAQHYLMVNQALETHNVHMLHGLPGIRMMHGEAEKLAYAQKLVANATGVATAMMGTAEGTINRFNTTVKGITKQFGEYVSAAVIPVIKWTTQLLDQFTKLDDTTKKLVVGGAFLVAGLLSFGPALASINAIGVPLFAMFGHGFSVIGAGLVALTNPVAIVTGLFTGLSAVVATVFSPIGLGIAAAATVITLLINQMGGWREAWRKVEVWATDAWQWIKTTGVQAWDYVQARAQEFLTWIQPAVDLAVGLFNAGWRKAGEVFQWIKDNITPWVETIKATALGVTVLVGGFVALKAAIALVTVGIAIAGGTFNVMFGGVGLLVGALVAGGYALGKWLQSIGGTAAVWDKLVSATGTAWDWITSKVSAFANWVKPIVAAYIGYITAGWELAVDFAKWAWDTTAEVADAAWYVLKTAAVGFMSLITGIWTDISKDASITWTDVKDFIVATFIGAEFVLRNFKLTAAFAWTTIKYDASVAWDSIKTGLLSVVAVGGGAAGSLVEAFKYAFAKIKGQDVSGDLSDAISRGWRSGFNTIITDFGSGESETTRLLRRQFEQQANALGESFAAFRERRLREINSWDWPNLSPSDQAIREAERAAQNLGGSLGGAFNKGVEKEMHKFDAVLTSSREALYRLAEYEDMLNRRPGATPAPTGSLPTFNPANVPPPSSAPAPVVPIPLIGATGVAPTPPTATPPAVPSIPPQTATLTLVPQPVVIPPQTAPLTLVPQPVVIPPQTAPLTLVPQPIAIPALTTSLTAALNGLAIPAQTIDVNLRLLPTWMDDLRRQIQATLPALAVPVNLQPNVQVNQAPAIPAPVNVVVQGNQTVSVSNLGPVITAIRDVITAINDKPVFTVEGVNL